MMLFVSGSGVYMIVVKVSTLVGAGQQSFSWLGGIALLVAHQ